MDEIIREVTDRVLEIASDPKLDRTTKRELVSRYVRGAVVDALRAGARAVSDLANKIAR